MPIDIPDSIGLDGGQERDIQSRNSTSHQEDLSHCDNTIFYPARLESYQIRVLEILPASYSEPISCCFEYLDTTGSFVEYVALSYCWGKHVEWEHICLDGSEGFPVTPHLHQGLRRLRHNRESRYVWIDAICINQADEEEKSHQVQQMGSIYGWAQRTVIWLGEMDASQPTCRRDRDGICSNPNISAFEHQQAAAEIRVKLDADEHRSRHEDHYMSVWWKRLWVVQELAASRETPTVLIGPHSITWDFFTQIGWDSGSEKLQFFARLRQQGRQSLFELLRSTLNGFACGRVEDGIFALLGVVDDDQLPLRVDYGKPWELVYAEAVKYMAEKHGSVNILLDDTFTIWRSQKSSWIPIWHRLLKSKDDENACSEYAACTYAPQLGLRLREEQQPSDQDYLAIQIKPCACKGRAELEVRSLPFDSVAKVLDMETLPQLGSLWEENLMKTKLLSDCFSQGKFWWLELTGNYLTDHLLTEGTELLKCLRTELWAPTYILGALGVDGHREKVLDLDRLPNIGYLMLYYLFEGRRTLVDMFDTHLNDAREHDSQVLCTAEAFGFKNQDAVIRDLTVAFRWQEPFLWKVHNGERVRSLRREHGHPSLARNRDGTSQHSIHLSWNSHNHLRRWLQENSSWSKIKHPKGSGFKPNDALRTMIQDIENLDETYRDEIPLSGASRVFFSTKDGFTGLGPAGLKEGDEIVVPFGSSRPWVLRNHGDHHVLIGGAVVPSVMSGRLETLCEEGLISAVDYKLL